MGERDLFDRILVSLHDAMLDDVHWHATAKLIDEACRTKGNMLGFGERRSNDDVQIFFARFCHRGERRQDWEREYCEVYYPRDERIPRLMQLPPSHLMHVKDLYTDEELKTSPVYNEALLRSESQNSLNVCLDGPGGSDIGWVISDPSGPGSWETAQIEMIERLLPHIRQFVCVRDVLAGSDALGASLTGLLETTRSGVIHLDRRGRIVEANAHARGILRQADGLSDQGGFLGAWLPADNANLQRLLARVLPSFGSQGVSGSITIGRLSRQPRLLVHVNPVTDSHSEFRNRRVAALVLIVDPASQPRINPRLVAEILGLTPTEGRVAAMLAEGRTVRDIAMATNRQEGAVYWLLHQIYRKHGISRQVDLVRLVLSLSGLSGPLR